MKDRLFSAKWILIIMRLLGLIEADRERCLGRDGRKAVPPNASTYYINLWWHDHSSEFIKTQHKLWARGEYAMVIFYVCGGASTALHLTVVLLQSLGEEINLNLCYLIWQTCNNFLSLASRQEEEAETQSSFWTRRKTIVKITKSMLIKNVPNIIKT